MTHIKYLEQQAKNAYGKDNINFYKKDFEKPTTREKVKDQAMSKDDFLRLREAMKDSTSFSKDALEISYRCGLRVDEVAHLKAEHINLSKKEIYVSSEGAKNGRARTVLIREKDLSYFKDLKDRSAETGYLTKIQSKSIDKTIRRYMKNIKDEKGQSLDQKYEKETIHAIRKLYATERMREIRGLEPLEDKKEEMKAWGKVCEELGHSQNRDKLYNTYCKG